MLKTKSRELVITDTTDEYFAVVEHVVNSQHDMKVCIENSWFYLIRNPYPPVWVLGVAIAEKTPDYSGLLLLFQGSVNLHLTKTKLNDSPLLIIADSPDYAREFDCVENITFLLTISPFTVNSENYVEITKQSFSGKMFTFLQKVFQKYWKFLKKNTKKWHLGGILETRSRRKTSRSLW